MHISDLDDGRRSAGSLTGSSAWRAAGLAVDGVVRLPPPLDGQALRGRPTTPPMELCPVIELRVMLRVQWDGVLIRKDRPG